MTQYVVEELRLGTNDAPPAHCGFSPLETDDCGAPAQWHIQVTGARAFRIAGDRASLMACHGHQSYALRLGTTRRYHEWTEACSQPESWWAGDRCVDTDQALTLGLIEEPGEDYLNA